jgi:uncharacterized surface protein with fasciclin (FAS1) repeats
MVDELIKKSESYTIFAPTDEAFGKHPRSRWDKIFNDTEARLGQFVLTFIGGRLT